MKHLRPANRKARRIVEHLEHTDNMEHTGHGEHAKNLDPIDSLAEDVVAMQQNPVPPMLRPHVPMGCALAFSPGWEVDSSGGTAGLCQPVERDIYDCYVTCFWPAQVPDHLNNYPNWAAKCAVATKDWRNLDLVFP